MTKMFLLLLFTFSLVSNCENKNKEESSSHHTETKGLDKVIPHDSLLIKENQTPPIIKDGKLPPKKNDSI